MGCLANRPLCRTKVNKSRNSSPAVDPIVSPRRLNGRLLVRYWFLFMVRADGALCPQR